MLGREAFNLVKDLSDKKEIGPFNDVAVRQVLEEMKTLYDANIEDAEASVSGEDNESFLSVEFRHIVLNRNKRCLLAYLNHRMRKLRQMRWEYGSILPEHTNANLLNAETEWFQSYNKSLANYMRTIGDEGLNLMLATAPPKSLYIEVRCLTDYGKLEFENGDSVILTKNTHHLLPRSECEPLIRQGILEHFHS